MHMKKKAPSPLMRIIGTCLVFVLFAGIGVMANNAKLKSVKIILSNNYEMTVLTAKTNVLEILDENHITLQDDEVVVPNINAELSDNKTIKVLKASEVEQEAAQVEETSTTEQILQSYSSITEKIVVEQIEIPFETITKEAAEEGTKQNKVVQEGQNGIKEVTYKVKYQNDTEIERIEISSKVIKEPVNKIVEVKTIKVTSRSEDVRVATTGSVAEYQAYAKSRCEAYGWSNTDFLNLVALWNKESGWRVTAQNRSSGAYGIPQALPGKKMASAGSDYLSNYKTQIDWGLGYIKSRYGSPTAAWNHSKAKGWY